MEPATRQWNRQLPSRAQPVATLVTTSEAQFRLTAVKLPEEAERNGVIVRGYNTTGGDLWVTLTPWRRFGIVEVVTMDEVSTGGKLPPDEQGAIRFKAAPHQILTFWFHD